MLGGLMQLMGNAPSEPLADDEQEIGNDDLTTEKESQMLTTIPGISVTKKPRKDGRYQGHVTLGGEKHYFYGRAYDEVVLKIKFYIEQWKRLQIEQTGVTVTSTKRKAKTPRLVDYIYNWIETYKKPNLKPASLLSLQ